MHLKMLHPALLNIIMSGLMDSGMEVMVILHTQLKVAGNVIQPVGGSKIQQAGIHRVSG